MKKYILIVTLLVFSVGFISAFALLSFANKQKLLSDVDWVDEFAATASFTSSAVVGSFIPEPATIVLLGIGALSLIRRKK